MLKGSSLLKSAIQVVSCALCVSPVRAGAIALLLLPVLSGCIESEPRAIPESDLLRLGQTRQVGGVSVTFTPLGPSESKRLLGFDAARSGIQPVWIRVVNREPVRWLLPPITIDSDYFSPLEVAAKGHRLFAKERNKRLDDYLFRLEMPDYVPAQGVSNGYVFVNVDEAVKFASFELIGSGDQAPVRRFTFFADVTGHTHDFETVKWDQLYPAEKQKDLSVPAFKRWLEQDLPCCALGGDRRTPGDPLNVIIVGNRDVVFHELAMRDWDTTQTISIDSIWRTVISAVYGLRYRYSPISPLYVFDRSQDIALQKGRGDVHHRNHMRLWLAPVTVLGKPVWVGQISRDIGVRLTRRTIVTHRIDPSVDETRWYLLQDLFYTHGLSRFGYVNGVGASSPERPRVNYTGDPYITDGRRAVFWLTNPAAIPFVQMPNSTRHLLLGSGRHRGAAALPRSGR
jgi:hypothetical protein